MDLWIACDQDSKSRILASEHRDQIVRVPQATFGLLELRLPLGRIATQCDDVVDSDRGGFVEVGPKLLDGRSDARQV